jgi:ribosomal protein S14
MKARGGEEGVPALLVPARVRVDCSRNLMGKALDRAIGRHRHSPCGAPTPTVRGMRLTRHALRALGYPSLNCLSAKQTIEGLHNDRAFGRMEM